MSYPMAKSLEKKKYFIYIYIYMWVFFPKVWNSLGQLETHVFHWTVSIWNSQAWHVIGMTCSACYTEKPHFYAVWRDRPTKSDKMLRPNGMSSLRNSSRAAHFIYLEKKSSLAFRFLNGTFCLLFQTLTAVPRCCVVFKKRLWLVGGVASILSFPLLTHKVESFIPVFFF